MKTFEYHFKVIESHLDTFGHMNHATYLQVFEQARWDMINAYNWGIDRILKEKVGPTILEAKVQYKRELKLHDEIKILTQIQPYQGKMTTIMQDMVNKDDKVCAHAELLIGVFDMEKRRLIQPPEDWLIIGREED